MVFTVTIPGNNPYVISSINSPILIQGAYNVISSSGNTTFNFRGKFRDNNIKQVFRVNYYTPSNVSAYKDFEFKRIKSLFFDNSANCTIIQPNYLSIDAPSCQISNFNISFNNIKWQTAFENITQCFGSIISYDYLLPSGWKLGTTTSNGSTWITANNNVNITSNLITGGQIAIRPSNNCSQGLQNNQFPQIININRTNSPILKINNNTSLTIKCGDADAKVFTVTNVGQCITSFEWEIANKGWNDVNGNPILSNITTTSPTITIYPSCNATNPPQNVSVKIKTSSEEINSTLPITFSTSKPDLQISGPAEFCNSASYSIPISSSCGSSVNWSLAYLNNHTNIASLSCTSCLTPTLSKINNGTALLKATVTFPGCGTTAEYEKYIGVGTPVIRGWYNSPTNIQQPIAASSKFEFNWNDACYTTLINTNMDITANSSVVWENASNSGGVTWYQNHNNLNFYFSDLDQWAYFRVTSTNYCGSLNWLYRFRSVGDDCLGGNILRVMLSPNPTSSNLNIGLVEIQDNKKIKEILEIKILDKLGTIKQKWNYGKLNKAEFRSLNTNNLKADIYTILVYDGQSWFAEQFIKQ